MTVQRVLWSPTVALATSLAVAASGGAQAPDTDVFLADLRILDGHIEIGEPRNITNRPGYDNQPWFLRDGSALLYTADVGGQTDVFRYHIATGERTRLTNTPENEYSPTLTEDGREMLVVRWAADMSAGHLWRYSTAGEPMGVHPADVPRVGYYGVVDEHTVAVFVNDSARSFVIADARTGTRTRLGDGLGGSPPRRIPGQPALSFVQPDSAGTMWLKRLDLETRQITPIARTLPGSVNYAWTAGGLLLMPSENRIYMRDPARDTEWREVVRFEDEALRSISRIAISATGDRIALVATRGE